MRTPEDIEWATRERIWEDCLLFEYASSHWAAHFASASLLGTVELQGFVIKLLNGKTARGSNCLRMYWRSNEPGLPSPNDFDPIVTASYFGHTVTLKTLLSDSPVNKTDVGSRALYWAPRMGHYDVVNLFLQEEVDPNTKYADDETALTLAIRFNRTHVVHRLLEDEGFIPEANEYRVNYAGKDGQTPLSTAAKNGALDIVTQLLQHSKIRPRCPIVTRILLCSIP